MCLPTPEYHNKDPIEPFHPFEADEDTVFRSEDDVSKLFKGDLYVIGKLWVDTLRLGLVGRKISLFPEVTAKCKGPPEPQKPPPMKYQDLPLEGTPHADYVEHKEKKCPDADLPTFQHFLFPYVQKYRKEFLANYRDLSKDISETYNDFKESVVDTLKDARDYLRDDQHLFERQALVAGSTGLGFISGLGKSFPNKLVRATIGALASGSLCFPKETDEYFKIACKTAFRGVKMFTNFFFETKHDTKESLSCKPEEIKNVKSQCEDKCKKKSECVVR